MALEKRKDGNPKLWLKNRVPYEHEIVKYEELHPELKEKVDEIRGFVLASRLGIAWWANSLANPDSELLNPLIGLGSILASLMSDTDLKYTKLTQHCAENLFVPYYLPNKRTIKLGGAIKKIAGNGESPFSRPDSRQLLERFHYGVVDNAGNLVLLRHPSLSAKQGWDKFVEQFYWGQPLQRTRFEIQKPPKRERAKVPKFRFALAPAML
ncbi:hypothetical protein HY095_01285 [Candidatus Micrarchaeota archaeon]|nr:hypothetical protein [Candidatus Micrarchaeota archaeon]